MDNSKKPISKELRQAIDEFANAVDRAAIQDAFGLKSYAAQYRDQQRLISATREMSAGEAYIAKHGQVE